MAAPWLKGYLKNKEVQIVEEAVAAAELKTSGEIVPVIVRSSSTVGHVPLVLFLFILSLGGVLSPILRSWDWFLVLPSSIEVLVILMVAAIFASVAGRWSFLQRSLVPLSDRRDQAFARAELEFYHSRMSETRDGTGVLIFVSLLERQVVVLADRGIDSVMEASTWDEVLQDVLSGIKKKNMKEGLVQAIHRCGDILSEHFPIQPDDENELSNKLIIKE